MVFVIGRGDCQNRCPQAIAREPSADIALKIMSVHWIYDAPVQHLRPTLSVEAPYNLLKSHPCRMRRSRLGHYEFRVDAQLCADQFRNGSVPVRLRKDVETARVLGRGHRVIGFTRAFGGPLERSKPPLSQAEVDRFRIGFLHYLEDMTARGKVVAVLGEHG